MTAGWVPPGKTSFFDNNGDPLVGGKVHFYIPGTSVRKDTWQDYNQVSLNTNPITLDARGEATIYGVGAYRQVLNDSLGNEIWDRTVTVGNTGTITLAAGAIFGLTIGNNTGNPNTQVDIQLGQARDSTNVADIVLTGPFTKDLSAVWAAGTGNGMRDVATALAAAQSWHIFVILNPVTPAVDVLASQSATNPVLPNGYTLFRRIASLPVLGGSNRPPSGTAIPLFQQWGNQFLLASPNNEYSAQTGSTAALLRAFLVPLGIKVGAILYVQNDLVPPAVVLMRITDPDLGVPPAFGGTNQFATVRIDATSPAYPTALVTESTNTFGQLYIQVSDATATWAVKTRGWIDHRGG